MKSLEYRRISCDTFLHEEGDEDDSNLLAPNIRPGLVPNIRACNLPHPSSRHTTLSIASAVQAATLSGRTTLPLPSTSSASPSTLPTVDNEMQRYWLLHT